MVVTLEITHHVYNMHKIHTNIIPFSFKLVRNLKELFANDQEKKKKITHVCLDTISFQKFLRQTSEIT